MPPISFIRINGKLYARVIIIKPHKGGFYRKRQETKEYLMEISEADKQRLSTEINL